MLSVTVREESSSRPLGTASVTAPTSEPLRILLLARFEQHHEVDSRPGPCSHGVEDRGRGRGKGVLLHLIGDTPPSDGARHEGVTPRAGGNCGATAAVVANSRPTKMSQGERL